MLGFGCGWCYLACDRDILRVFLYCDGCFLYVNGKRTLENGSLGVWECGK